MKNKIIAGIFCLMLFSLASAALLTIIFGAGVIHLMPNHTGEIGSATKGVAYWLAADGYDSNPAAAVPVEDFNTTGLLQFTNDFNVGGCSWEAVIKSSSPTLSDGRIRTESLDGQGVSDDQYLYWAVIPSARGVTSCQIQYDLNVSSS